MGSNSIGLLHYSAPPTVGGVEAVLHAQARLFGEHGYPVTVIAGSGEAAALPGSARFIKIPILDSQDPQILDLSRELNAGRVPPAFEDLASQIEGALRSVVCELDILIVHNVLTKHFNLPLSAALIHLLDRGEIHGCIAWCHDLTWASTHSRSQVHPGYPWDLLRTGRPDVTYVAVSKERRRELAGLFGWPEERILVVYNGVDPDVLLGLSPEGRALVERLGLADADLVLLLPVRVTQAKNIEYALQVVSALKASGSRPRLVITGPPDPHDPQNMEYYFSLLELRDSLGLKKEAHFVYASGLQPGQPYTIPSPLVAELFRSSDLLFMPSRREGFGMPVLEAGLLGLPVVSAPFPAATEIGDGDILIFEPENESPKDLAKRLLRFAEESPIIRLRRRIRQNLTWESLFIHQIQPLVESVKNS